MFLSSFQFLWSCRHVISFVVLACCTFHAFFIVILSPIETLIYSNYRWWFSFIIMALYIRNTTKFTCRTRLYCEKWECPQLTSNYCYHAIYIYTCTVIYLLWINLNKFLIHLSKETMNQELFANKILQNIICTRSCLNFCSCVYKVAHIHK